MAGLRGDFDETLGHRLKLRDLQLLSAVVRWGSMAKAAAHVGISQPSISEAIASLENALGVRLLDRNPRGVEPTIYGTSLLKRGLVIFDELRQGLGEIESLSDPNVGEVRVGCPETLAAGFLPAIIDRVSQLHPQVTIQVLHADSATSDFKALREREIDLMLGRTMESSPLDDELQAETLFEESYSVVAGADSPWVKHRKLSLKDLASERWIHLPPNNQLSSLLEEAFRAERLNVPKASVSCFSMHLRVHLLSTGRYLTIMPASMLRFNTEQWSLKPLPIRLKMRRRFGAVITMKHRTHSPAVQMFMKYTREIANLMPKPSNRKNGMPKNQKKISL